VRRFVTEKKKKTFSQWNIQKHFGTKGNYAEGRETQKQESINTVQSMNAKNSAGMSVHREKRQYRLTETQ